MSSAVYYRFKSQKSPHRINFDGTGISIFDLKREILLANKLEATAGTFELRLSNPDTGEIYDDDSEVVPRATSVEARRVPSIRQGDRNAAAKYVSGHLVVSAKNAARRENFKRPAVGAEPSAAMAMPSGVGGPEDEMMQAVFAAQGEQWKRTQEEMAEKAPVYYNNDPNANKPPPPSYICYRCGQKGHWITQCPSIDDVKRVRKTTGIPKSMLRTVEKPADDDSGTYLMNADGEYVVAVADEKSWQDFQKRQRLVQQKTNKRVVPENLQDPITGDLFVDPKKTPCCSKTYSDATIQDALINSEFECPNCHKKDVYIDQLIPDKDMEKELEEYNGKQNQPNEEPVETDATDEYDLKDNDISREKLRRASTSTYSESASSRSSSPEPTAEYSPAHSVGTPDSAYSVGEASPASAGDVAACASQSQPPTEQSNMQFFPPFMAPPFAINGTNAPR